MESLETHIISMERGATKNSGSPMWRCETDSGDRVNVFQHRDPYKDSFHMFEVAGYGDFMKEMALGDKLLWRKYPIEVHMTKNGQWFEVLQVAHMPDGAQPDSQAAFTYDFQQYRREASDWAKQILTPRSGLRVVAWDSETMGLNDDDEILTIGIANAHYDERFHVLIKPQQMDRVENQIDVHGISTAEAEAGQFFPDVYWQVRPYLENAIWLLYNAPFDSGKLEAMCLRYGMSPILPLAVVDVMEMFSRYICEYDPKRGRLKVFTLEAAAELMGIQPERLHDAAADAETTLKLVEAMRDWIDL